MFLPKLSSCFNFVKDSYCKRYPNGLIANMNHRKIKLKHHMSPRRKTLKNKIEKIQSIGSKLTEGCSGTCTLCDPSIGENNIFDAFCPRCFGKKYLNHICQTKPSSKIPSLLGMVKKLCGDDESYTALLMLANKVSMF